MNRDNPPFAGLAAERTALAWQRSSMSLVAIGALVVRWSMVEHFPAWPGIVLTAVVAAGSFFAVRSRYRRVLDAVSAGQTPRSRYLVPLSAGLAAVVVICVGVGMIVEYSKL